MNVSKEDSIMETKTKTMILIEKIKEAIIAAYPEDIWWPILEEEKAKDGVAAQLLRDMAPAMANIAYIAIEDDLALAKQETEKAVLDSIRYEIEVIEEGIQACKDDSAQKDCRGNELHYIYGKSQALKIMKVRVEKLLDYAASKGITL